MENRILLSQPELPHWMPEAVRLFTDNAPDFMRPVVGVVCDALYGALGCNAVCEHPLFERTEYTTLMTAIWAPPSSGKSFIDNIARKVLAPLKKVDELNGKKYQIKLEEYNQTPLAKRKSAPDFPPLRCQQQSVTRVGLLKSMQATQQMNQILVASEIDSMLERGRFTSFRDIARNSFDGAETGQMTATTEGFTGSTEVHLSLLVAGTPNQLFKLINNYEDGLASRVEPMRLPDRWVSEMTMKRMTDKQKQRLKALQDIYINSCYVVEENDYIPRERTSYDVKFLLPVCKTWDSYLHDEWDETKDPVFAQLGSRCLEIGLRSVLAYLPLYPHYLKNNALQEHLREYCLYRTRLAFYNFVCAYGDEVRKVADVQNTFGKSASLKQSVFSSLAETFTRKDVGIAMEREGRVVNKNSVKSFICRLRKANKIKKIGKQYIKTL